MKSLVERLASYAEYHRDKRNIATHFVGIPMILASLPLLPLNPIAGVPLFAGGWALQFVGHYFEGRKPAFLDDLCGLFDGLLFIVAEIAFALGLSPALREEIERRVGPTRWGKVAAAQPDLAVVAA